MNIFEKLQTMRVELQGMNIKKSGQNKFAGYNYYELGDFLPAINALMHKYKVTSLVSFAEKATLTLVNSEKPEETIVFESPMEAATLKGAHPIQNLGAVETYSRRYLYMTAFEIVESDALDATQGLDNGSKNNNSGGTQRTRQRTQNTGAPPITEESKKALNTAISAYVELSGSNINDVMGQLKKATGKSHKEYTEADAKKALDALNKMQHDLMEEMGV